jgi:AraC family transcriptional regulator of adaptative response/methylated-DNA-[protein]-cysteine methyltransferase
VLERDDGAADALLRRVFPLPTEQAARGLSLWVRGTNFQVQVWCALLRIPFAGLLSYSQVAGLLGRPRAARSVATAIAQNPVAYLIPCHRVLRGNGEFGLYHWGEERKQAICTWEAARDDAGA